MRRGSSQVLATGVIWLSGLAGLVIGFEVYSRINPRFHSPFFGDALGMVFVVTVYLLLYVTVGSRLQKWLGSRIRRRREKG
ncbi:MAG: hypothetical protein RMM08_07715 [Armatimonadota bacterium]|nr:hypothetical protein [Armatimonadota bacterium]